MNEKILPYAFRLLGGKMYSEKDLMLKLQKKFPNEMDNIKEALEYLKDNTYIDDEAFALKYLQYRLQTSPQGKQKMLFELYKKGISNNIANKCISTHYKDEKPYAQSLAKIKEKSLQKNISPHDKKKKIWQFLKSRGFSTETIFSLAE